MAKRTAESQKTKDDQNSDGEESVEVSAVARALRSFLTFA